MAGERRVVDRFQLGQFRKQHVKAGTRRTVAYLANHLPKGVTSLERRTGKQVSQSLLQVRSNTSRRLLVVATLFEVLDKRKVMFHILALWCPLKNYCVHILASKSRVLYIGVTNNLERRLFEHRQKLVPGFTAKYSVKRLVYYELFENIRDAIAREKQIEAWRREKKIALIERANPEWRELSEAWQNGRDSSTSSD